MVERKVEESSTKLWRIDRVQEYDNGDGDERNNKDNKHEMYGGGEYGERSVGINMVDMQRNNIVIIKAGKKMWRHSWGRDELHKKLLRKKLNSARKRYKGN